MKQISLGTLSYETANNTFPMGRQQPNTWSQHSLILPFIDQFNIYRQIDFANQATGASPVRLITIDTFICPTDLKDRMLDPTNSADQYGWGKNNYRANAGSDVGTTTNSGAASAVEQNNGIFLTNQVISPAHITDGASQTALFSEAIRGDANDNAIEVASDLFQLANTKTTTTAAEVYQNCVAVVPSTMLGTNLQTSYAGRDWVNGNYMTTRYTHIMPPNSLSCPRGNSPNDNGGATTASSRHPGGVNMALVDGSVRFVVNGVSVTVWQALGSRAGGGSLPLGAF